VPERAAHWHHHRVISDGIPPSPRKCVLLDVDGTLIDAVDNQRRVWATWARRYGLDADEVYRVALRTRPVETFAQVAPDRNPQDCLAGLHELEDADVRSGDYTAFDGAADLLGTLPPTAWALVTSNYEHRVRGRFSRTGLPVPPLVVDAAAVQEGKPSPEPYLQAARQLGVRPEDCLVIEDAPSGVEAGLRAGMTVWGVNASVPVPGVHRHFATLRAAVPEILAFAETASPSPRSWSPGRHPVSFGEAAAPEDS
jgi:sugar-phosphatase